MVFSSTRRWCLSAGEHSESERGSTSFVDERTGRLRTLKTPAVTLEGVWCTSLYSNKKMFCPRAIPSWWREVWLERVEILQPDLGSRSSLHDFGEPRYVIVS